MVNRKVFSIWRNLKYVTIGLLIVSVTFGFLFSSAAFPFGGRVGDMISSWLTNFLGTLGTAALLLVVGISYLIWQFNPTINLPQRNLAQEPEEVEEPEGQELQAPAIKASAAATIHDLYTEAASGAAEKGNVLKGEGGMIITENGNLEEAGAGFGITEKEVPGENQLTIHEPMLDKEIVDDILHTHDLPVQIEETNVEPLPKKTEKKEPEKKMEEKDS